MALEWEELDSKMLVTDVFRARVPGGWLVMVKGGLFFSRPKSITFYPDPEHE